MIQSSKGPKVSSDHPLGKQGELTSSCIHEWFDIFLLRRLHQNADQDRVDGIDFGANQKPEKLSKNFTHVVVMTFFCLLACVVIFFMQGLEVRGCLVGFLGWFDRC